MSILITPGDPAGVGPEVAVRAIAGRGGDVVLVGDRAAIAPWCARLNVGVPVMEPDAPGPIEVRAIEYAVQACLTGAASPMVTGPISQ